MERGESGLSIGTKIIKTGWIHQKLWWFRNPVDSGGMLFRKSPFPPPPPSEGGREMVFFEKAGHHFSNDFQNRCISRWDESPGSRVFEIRFSWLSIFQFGAFYHISTQISRDIAQSNHHRRSIDLVEISWSVVKSSKMDPCRSKYDHFQFINEISLIPSTNVNFQ